jgi:hypothetical protein
MMTSRGLPLYVPERVEHADRCPSFDRARKGRNGHLRRDHHHQMPMIVLHGALDDLTVQLLAQGTQTSTLFCTDLTGAHTEAVCWRSYHVLLAVPHRV